MSNNQTIIYVNFKPYENAGRILDFLINKFDTVILFSFNFHHLGPNQKTSSLQIFQKGKLYEYRPLWQVITPPMLTFLFLPLRSLMILIQLVWHTLKLKWRYNKIDVYFTVNAYTAWIGNLLRSIKLVEKTVFWVWDYYPPIHEKKLISLMLWFYWQFDKIGSQCNKLVFLNQRLQNLRKEIGIMPLESDCPIIPIGTDPIKNMSLKHPSRTNIIIGFLGVVKRSQGLDLIFDNASQLLKLFPNIKLEIIGSGPDQKYFKKRAKQTSLLTHFYGFIPDKEEVSKIMSRFTIGIAPYVPEKSNVSYYSDNSKIKDYLSQGIPVIATNVFTAEEVAKEKAGIIVNYYKPEELFDAILKIISNYKFFQENALKLAERYYYKKIYPALFKG